MGWNKILNQATMDLLRKFQFKKQSPIVVFMHFRAIYLPYIVQNAHSLFERIWPDRDFIESSPQTTQQKNAGENPVRD